MKSLAPIVTASLLCAIAFTGCETSGQSALAGAAAGAAIGGAFGGHRHDALHGAAIGAGAGYLLGKIAQSERRSAYDRGYYDARADAGDGYYRERERDSYGYQEEYPVGRFSDRPGFVRSPYRPYYTIDVRRIPRGAKVVDPSCDRIFINP